MSTDEQCGERSRRRLIVAGIIAGAVAIVLVVVAGVLVLAHHLSDSGDPLVALQSRYQHRYDLCRRGGGGPTACTKTVSGECATDPYFPSDDNVVSDLSTVCLDFASRKH